MRIETWFENHASEGDREFMRYLLRGADEMDARRRLGRMAANARGGNPEKRFTHMGQFLAAVHSAGTHKRPIDVRLTSGFNEGAGNEGGFLVSEDLAAGLLDDAFDGGAILSRVTELPISAGANKAKVPSLAKGDRTNGNRNGGVSVFWAAEAGQHTATTPKPFELIAYELGKVTGLLYVTDEMLEDVPLLAAWVDAVLGRELTWAVEDAILNGDGVGVPLGILNSPALITVAAEGSQTAATVNAANVTKMWARLCAGSRSRATWLCHSDALGQLAGLASQGVTYMPPNESAPCGALFGRPIVPVEQCAALGTKGDLILCDLSLYGLAAKGGPQMQTSMHVRFEYDETAFKFTMRVDGKPLWGSTSTPTNGSNAQSPFVALAAR